MIAMLDDRGLAAHDAARLTGVPAVDLSPIRTAGPGRFTLDRLMTMLLASDANAGATV